MTLVKFCKDDLNHLQAIKKVESSDEKFVRIYPDNVTEETSRINV